MVVTDDSGGHWLNSQALARARNALSYALTILVYLMEFNVINVVLNINIDNYFHTWPNSRIA